MRVIAVAGKENIAFAEGADDAGCDRLLADVHVQISADFSAAKLALGGLFEAADENHLPQDLGPVGRAYCVDDGSSGLCLLLGHGRGRHLSKKRALRHVGRASARPDGLKSVPTSRSVPRTMKISATAASIAPFTASASEIDQRCAT